MKVLSTPLRQTFAAAGAFALLSAASAEAQSIYAVDDLNNLLRFNATTPTIVSTIGNIGFAPEGIDFNPANGLLYAIDIGATTTQLFTISLTTAIATSIGSFASVGTTPAAYNLGSTDSYGFDFNPKTLQADNSIRIRLVSSDGDDLRLNSATGQIAAVDPALNGSATSSVATAYSNNVAATSGTTALFQIDAGSDSLYTQNPPNNGTLVLTGPLGINVPLIAGFDIFTAADGTTNTAYLVADASAVVSGAELYTVNLTTGAASPVGATGLIGTGINVRDIAVQPLAVPEPGVCGMLLAGMIGMLGLRRRRSVA